MLKSQIASGKGMVLFISGLILQSSLWASGCNNPPENQNIIDGLLNQMQENYVFPEKAKAFALYTRQKEQQAALKSIRDCVSLSTLINGWLTERTGDKHLYLSYSEDVLPDENEAYQETMKQFERDMMKRLNYGINQVERLPFNIGYINVLMFAETELAKDTIDAAFGLMKHTDALIIDLRESRGGDPKTVDLMASYLLKEKTNTSNIWHRKGERLEKRFADPKFVRNHYGDERPLYILTSKDTFSAAEDFAYTLKHLKRATIIGEVTGGGAHPGDFYRLSEHFEIFIPNGRSINPVTNTNWEGVGVAPHEETSLETALQSAQVLALEKMALKVSDERRAKRLEQRIAMLKSEQAQ